MGRGGYTHTKLQNDLDMYQLVQFYWLRDDVRGRIRVDLHKRCSTSDRTAAGIKKQCNMYTNLHQWHMSAAQCISGSSEKDVGVTFRQLQIAEWVAKENNGCAHILHKKFCPMAHIRDHEMCLVSQKLFYKPVTTLNHVYRREHSRETQYLLKNTL
jgi:hypothetical protein